MKSRKRKRRHYEAHLFRNRFSEFGVSEESGLEWMVDLAERAEWHEIPDDDNEKKQRGAT